MILNGILSKINRSCNTLNSEMHVWSTEFYWCESSIFQNKYIFIFLSMLDQIIKINILLINKYNIYFNFKLIDIKIIYIINKGFIWGIGYNNEIIISILLLFLIYYYIIFYNKYFSIEWSVFLCGAISNFYDRIYNNYVIDYISINLYILNIELKCPIFNIGDILIFISIFYIFLKNIKN